MCIQDVASSPTSFKPNDARTIAIKVIASHLYGAKRRCGPKAKPADKRHYHGIAFEFQDVIEGAVALFDKLGPLPPDHSIDRIDPRGPYSLGNIRWAGAATQTANRVLRRRVVWVNAGLSP